MNKTLTPRIVRAYWDTPVNTPDGLGKPAMLYDETITVELIELGRKSTYLLSDCQLAAKPMSDITDDDAKECGSICGLHTGGSTVKRDKDGVYVFNDTYQLLIYFNGNIGLLKNKGVYGQDMRRVYEYLRSKSYYCDSNDIALYSGPLPDYKKAEQQNANDSVKVQFKIWWINYLMAPFSWSKWVDIDTFEYHSSPYLLQGKVNSVTNAKKFRITGIGTLLGTSPGAVPFDKLCQHGLVEDQVKYNK